MLRHDSSERDSCIEIHLHYDSSTDVIECPTKSKGELVKYVVSYSAASTVDLDEVSYPGRGRFWRFSRG